MLRKSYLVLSVILSVFCWQAAFSQDLPVKGREGYFVGVHGGAAFPEKFTDFVDTGYSVGVQYGYRLNNFRTALTVDYLENNFSNAVAGTYKLFDVISNFYYDMNYNGTIVPFFGVGVGYVNAWTDACTAANNQCSQVATGSHLGYQGLLGVGLQGRQLRVDLQYRYFTVGSSNDFDENAIEAVLSIFIN